MSNLSQDFNSVNRLKMDSEIAELNRDIQKSLSLIRHKYLITSNKRGVGKKSFAINLAVTLSKRGVKVGLMDLDFQGPDIFNMLGFKGFYNVDENNRFRPKSFSDNLQVITIKSIMRDGDQAVDRWGELKINVIRRFIAAVKWGRLDYLIVSSPPGTGDDSLTVAQTINNAKVIFVSTPKRTLLSEIEKLLSLYKTVKMPILGVVENMSGFFCTDCDTTGGNTLRESIIMEVDYLGRIPIDPHMVECADEQESYLEKFPDSETAEGYQFIVEKIFKDGKKKGEN